jgi:Zinc carboxypeptidase
MTFAKWNRTRRLSCLVLLLTATPAWIEARASADPLAYQDNATLEKDLKSLGKRRRDLVRLQAVAESREGRKVWLAELGRGKEEDRRQRPALLLVAGIEGHDLAGTALATAWMRHLVEQDATNETVRHLLDTTTVYVFPRLNPDAAVSFFKKPRAETSVNSRPVDEDHDGLTDEDGPEDLDGDGLITWMRVEDAEGEYILDETDPRILIKADRTKGEKGRWKLMMEGLDNDKDEAWNEDGPGGVNFNRNFPYDYPFFAPEAGRHQVSETETRALADFIVNHPNVGLAFTYGAADNLTQTPKGEGGRKRPPTALQDEDLPYYRELGKAWREALGLKKELTGAKEPGTFSDWIYFDRGRLSLAARPWTPALQLELAKNDKPKEDQENKEAKGEGKSKITPDHREADQKDQATPDKPEEKKESAPKKPAPDQRGEEERAFLKWIDQNAPEAFVPWKRFDHPDFPGRKVEVGGFAPYAKSNPPESALRPLAERQSVFLTGLLGKLPRVGIRKVELKHLGESVFDLKVDIENTGYLPTALSQGETAREVFPTRLVLDVENEAILSGSKRVMLGAIPGSGGSRNARWIFLAPKKSQVDLEVVSMLGGRLVKTIDLEAAKQ